MNVWAMAMVLMIGKNDAIIKPIFIYPDLQFGQGQCLLDKDEEERKQKIPMTCILIRGDEL